ncbi:MAG: 1-deoxy-D-xylulose-5-phosphate synthase [Bacteroidales bacterium]|nr:1-deoxy-D-xylulose-5-phosphate synthase [Bacteroidales bacterium]
MSPEQGKILSLINSPTDLKKFSEKDLPQLCDEIRKFIIEIISSNPGHLGASLGAVEIAVALHYVFNTPYDKLIWDVGHQAYAHKILTGRKDTFYTNRTLGGISGFPKMSESEYDAFGVGHASTSISAALGMSVASKLSEDNSRQHIAVIGDASISGGMAFEAINNAGVYNTNLLVILNDNGIAIDKNVGAVKEYLTDIVTSRVYNKFKDKVWKLMGGGSKYGENHRAIVRQIGNAVKSSILKKSNFFEAFKLRYFGPVDGHDVVRLAKLLNDIKKIPGPKLLHVITKKGKGFKHAEKDQTRFHSPGAFNKETGEIIEKTDTDKTPLNYQDVFGNTLVELAEKNNKIVGITPAMPTGSSMNIMMEKMPERAFDVGIAEEHAVTYAAGLAAQGFIPFCNIYSTFMQRAYDQIIHDVALQNLHVVMCLDRSGLVGEDGPTHHGSFDMAYLRSIPNIIISAPMNEIELRSLMFTAQSKNYGPFVIRYPRGKSLNHDWKKPMQELKPGIGRVIREGEDIAVITIGTVGNYVIEISDKLKEEGIDIAHYDMRYLKPADEDILHSVFKKFSKIITVEDGTITGGLGSTVLEFMSDNNYTAKVKRLGIPDAFIEHGKIIELHEQCGYSPEKIYEEIKKI